MARDPHRPKRFRRPNAGFTFIELLVVISVITLLISILLPVLGVARDTARAGLCLSNLRQLGLANAMYMQAFDGRFPYPTTAMYGTTHPLSRYNQQLCWYNALDPFFNTAQPDDPTRPGVAGERAYKVWKQCPDIDKIPASDTGEEQNLREFSRTFKMNTNLRLSLAPGVRRHASELDLLQPSNTVTYGDGNASDMLPWPADTNETGKFSMDVNSVAEAGVGIRHRGAANMLFADGHAAAHSLPTYERPSVSGGVIIKAWFPERLPSGQRRAQMPLVWSEPGRFEW